MDYIKLPFDISTRKENRVDSEDNMSAYVRLVHIAARAPDLDFYVNDKLTVRSLVYREFTEYIKLPAGTYNIKVYRANNRDFPLANVDIFIAPRSVTTIAAYRQRSKLSLYPVGEIPLISPTKGKAKIRFAQFIENIPPIDVVLSDGTVLYRGVNFKDITNYMELPIGRYTMILKLADTDIDMLYVPNINLKSDKYYTLYLIGLVNNFPSPQMLIPLDGISYLNI